MDKNQKILLEYLIKNNFIKKNDIKKLSNNKVNKLVDKIFDDFDDKDKYKANEYILLNTQLKKYDYLMCTEIGRINENENIFNYKNILEWDNEWWNFQKSHTDYKNMKTKYQKKWWKHNFSEYKNLYMNGDWFRWIEKKDWSSKEDKGYMIYGVLEGLHSHISLKISDLIDKRIDKEYPNMFYSNFREPMFKKIKNSKYFTMKKSSYRAGGFEKELKKLQTLKIENFYKIEEIISEKIKPYSSYTFTLWEYHDYKNSEKIWDGVKLMLVGGFEAAENISFKTFLDDFYEKEQPYGIVENLIEEIYSDIEKNIIDKWILKSKNV